jgi:hypothetical protein
MMTVLHLTKEIMITIGTVLITGAPTIGATTIMKTAMFIQVIMKEIIGKIVIRN